MIFIIEDWYNCDFITEDFSWEKYEVRIYTGVEHIPTELEKRKIKATFFCLGWIAEQNTWALEVLTELGFIYDCSLFPDWATARVLQIK